MSKMASQKNYMPDKESFDSRNTNGCNSVTVRYNDVCFSHVLNHRITLLHVLVALLLVVLVG